MMVSPVRLRASLTVLPLYALATVLFTWPLVRECGHAIPSTIVLVDARFQAFLLGWDWQALRTNPLGIFNPPIFHPETNTLAYMDHMIGETIFAAPFLAMSRSVAPGYNALVIFSFIASAWATYRLARILDVSRPAAFLAGFVFAFSPYRFGNIDQLNQLHTEFLPLALFFAIRYLRHYRARDLAGLGACALLQIYFGWYYTFYLAIAIGLLIVSAAVSDGIDVRRARAGPIAFVAVAVLVLALPVTLPYLEQGRAQPEFRRSLLEAETGSASVLDYLRINRNALLARWVPSAVGLQSHWPGLVAVVLGALGGMGILRRRAARARPGFASALRARLAGWGDGGYFLLLGSVAFVLSLGPYLHVAGRRAGITLPYSALYEFVPGFTSMRVPGRIGCLALLAIAVVSAFGWDALRQRLAGRRVAWRWLAVTIGLAAIVSAWQQPIALVELPTAATLPPAYAWLASQPGREPVLEVPTAVDENDEEELDVLRQSYVLFHGRPRLDGASGFVSPRYREFRVSMRGFPDEAALRAASELGARLVVVHFADYGPARRIVLEAQVRDATRLVPVASFGDDCVYGIAPP